MKPGQLKLSIGKNGIPISISYEALPPQLFLPRRRRLGTLRRGTPNCYRHNGGSAVFPEESFVFAAEPERSCELGALGTSVGGSDTCPYTRVWVEGYDEDVPNLGTLPQAERPILRESGVFLFTLRDLRDSIATLARSSLLVGLETEGPT